MNIITLKKTRINLDNVATYEPHDHDADPGSSMDGRPACKAFFTIVFTTANGSETGIIYDNKKDRDAALAQVDRM